MTEESTIDQIQKRGKIRVGMSTFKPWAMKDKTGKLIGFEIDVATRLAKDMEVDIEFVPTKWAGIIPGPAHRQIRCHHRRHGDFAQAQPESQLHAAL